MAFPFKLCRIELFPLERIERLLGVLTPCVSGGSSLAPWVEGGYWVFSEKLDWVGVGAEYIVFAARSHISMFDMCVFDRVPMLE